MDGARDCLIRLQEQVSAESEPCQEQLLELVTDLLLITSDQQKGSDTAVFGYVMERLAFEIAVEPRAAFSERIADASKAPRRLVIRLASDEIAVARPILERSECFTDHDLVMIAQACGPEHLLAISNRRTVAPSVTDIIVERGDTKILIRLAGNDGAEFSRRGLVLLLRYAKTDDELRSMLESRGFYRRGLLSRAAGRISDLLGQKASPRDAMADLEGGDGALLEATLIENAEEDGLGDTDRSADDDAPATGPEDDDVSDRKRERQRNGELISEATLKQVARAGDVAGAIQCLSVLAGLDAKAAEYFLLTAEVHALGVLCKAHDLSATTFAAVLQLRVSIGRLDVKRISGAMGRYTAMSRTRARKLLRLLDSM